jgi:hypothetical protein
MPFDPKSAKKAGKKSKRGPVKKEEPSIKEKSDLFLKRLRTVVAIYLTIPNIKLQGLLII